MTAIWQNNGTGWRLVVPTGFPNEQTLHDLVEETPQMLPLSGNPRLMVVGKEVALGNGYADLLAVEPSGRLAIVEIKLSKNAEARRAVVAQILTYAAHLKDLSPTTLEHEVLGKHLRDRGYESLQDAMASNDQEGSFDSAAFDEGLADSLANGHFHLVLVLDEAPRELVTLVGYLETVTEELLIDLITVSAYDIRGSQALIPQRVDAERPIQEPLPVKKTSSGSEGRYVEGAEDFAAIIASAEREHQPMLRRLYEWAISLDEQGFIKLGTYHGKGGDTVTLLPRLRTEKAGLVTVHTYKGVPSLLFWRSVFERRAPENLPRVERIAPVQIGQGNTTPEVSNELLEALTDAYREAASRKIGG